MSVSVVLMGRVSTGQLDKKKANNDTKYLDLIASLLGNVLRYEEGYGQH